MSITRFFIFFDFFFKIFYYYLINSPNLITQILIIIFTCLLSRARGLLETIKRLLIKTPSYSLNYKNKDPIYKQN